MKRLLFLTTFASIMIATPVLACSVYVTHEPSPGQNWREARKDLERPDVVIVDGEVIRPFIRGKQNALIRAHRVHRGQVREFYEVGERSSCDNALEAVGQRSRFRLTGGPDIFYNPGDEAFSTYFVDRILKSDRRKDWPYRPGAIATAP